jgi:outer membrane protein
VVRDQAVVELNVNNEQVLARQLEAARDRFEVGEITRTDVHQAEARLSGATADRIKAEGDLQASRAAYVKVIGEAPGGLEETAPPTDFPAGLPQALTIALDENPSVISAEFNQAAARDNVDQVRGELLPSVDLSGSAARAFEASSETSRSDSYTGKVTLTVPLYQSGSVYSRLRQARQELASKRNLVGEAKRDAEEQVTRAWETLQSTKARIRSYDAQITAAEVALEGVQREAAVGSRTVLDVLDAEQELLDAKVNLVRAKRDELVASFDLKSALGRLTATALGLEVDVYDPAAHYGEVRGKWTGGRSSGDAD